MIGEEAFRQYSVLVPMIHISDITYILFEKRSHQLSRQPGEICFPGGKLEGEETFQECAVRETCEELQVQPEQIEMMGPGDIYVSPFHIMIHPFIGVIKNYEDTFSRDEVDEVIKIPLEFLKKQEPEKYLSTLISKPPDNFPYDRIPGGESYPWAQGTYEVLFYTYEDQIIWGLTAQIVHSAVKLMKEYNIS